MMHNPLATKKLHTLMEGHHELWHAMCFGSIHNFHTKEIPQPFFELLKRYRKIMRRILTVLLSLGPLAIVACAACAVQRFKSRTQS